jgi:hypothetical protein
MPLWSCPPISPQSAGVACPVLLYGVKTIPPTRVECRQTMMSGQQHCKTDSGPNHCHSQRRHLQRNPSLTTPKRTLFYVPCLCKQLTDWAFWCIDDNNAPDTTHTDNDNDTISFNSTLPEPHSSEWTNKIADGDISWNSMPSSALPQDKPRNGSTTVVEDNEDDTISFDSTLPESHSSEWTNKIVDDAISWNSRPSSAPPKDNPHNESTTIITMTMTSSHLTQPCLSLTPPNGPTRLSMATYHGTQGYPQPHQRTTVQ